VPVPAKILVVDDHEFVRRTLCSMLSQQSQWKNYEAENGKVALEQILEITFDVAVLDILMPEMGGIEAACEIRRHAPQTKVILISGYYTPEEATMLARVFADGAFIQKSELDGPSHEALLRNHALVSSRTSRDGRFLAKARGSILNGSAGDISNGG
jgi:DNA-binding NarL/FixJ family response regulator